MKFIKIYLPIIFVIFSISSIAHGYNKNHKAKKQIEIKCECPPPPVCCDLPEKPTIAAYNAPSNIKVCNTWDFFGSATFLYIQPMQEQMEFGQTTYPISGSIYTGETHKFSFDWKAAFKLGIGYNFPMDNWNAFIQYTRINSSVNNSTSKSTQTGAVLRDTWLFQTSTIGSSATGINAKWKLNFNIFDFELGRPYFVGKNLTFKSHFGIRSGWIDQQLNTNFIGTNTYGGIFKSDSWLVGPRAGVNTNFELNNTCSFFGNGAISLFYQKFDKVTLREPLESNSSLWHSSQDLINNSINSSLEAMFGFGYDRYFRQNKYHCAFKIGYETQIYTEQNMMRYLQMLIEGTNSTSIDIVTKPGNLFFHGFSLNAKFNF